jgi:hypothetical protein
VTQRDALAHPKNQVTDAQLIQYARERGLELVPRDDTALASVPSLERSTPVRLPTTYGVFMAAAYRFAGEQVEQLVLTKGLDPKGGNEVTARLAVHQECLLGDVSRSAQCSCREHLDLGLAATAGAPRAVLVYLRHARPDSSVRVHHVLDIIRDLGVPLVDLGDSAARIPTAELVASALPQQRCIGSG